MQTATRYAALTGVAVLFVLFAISWMSDDATRRAKPEQRTIYVSVGDEQQEATPDTTAQEHVINLPEDAGLWQTVFVFQTDPPTDPASRQLKAMFAANARLRSLLAQTKVFEYAASDRLYKLRYSKLMGGATPQLWLQTDEGRVIYKVSGANIPANGDQLADEIQKNIETTWPCPRPKPPQPTPVPVPVPVPVPQPPAIPDIRPAEPKPEPEPVDNTVPLFAGIGLVVCAGLAGLYVEWQKSKN